MTPQVENFANEAVYILQMNSATAVRYIARNGRCTTAEAERALRSVLTFHRRS